MPQPRKYASNSLRQAAYRARCERARRASLVSKGLPALPAIAALPGWKRWNASFAVARALVEGALDEMRDYYDDRSENWQQSERGEEHQQRITTVEEALDALDGLEF